MKITEIFASLVLMAATPAIADHWTSPGDVSSAAHQLDSDSAHFARQVRLQTGYSHLSSDATRLARSADHLHEQVERGFDYYHVLSDWQRVQNDFHHLEQAFERAHYDHHNVHLQRDFQRVQNAYYRLEWAMTRGTGGGGGGRQLWECKASDAGWEEHFGGHSASGYDRYEAERNALYECQRFHGRCRISSCSVIR